MNEVMFMHVKCIFTLCEYRGEFRFASAITPFMLCAPLHFVFLGILNIVYNCISMCCDE